MPSPFDALDAALSGAVLSAFGESVAASLRPRTRSEFAEGADSSRPARPIRGVFNATHGNAELRGAAKGGGFSGVTRLSVNMAEFWVPASEARAIPYEVRQKDHIVFTGRAGQPVYSISDIQPTDMGDLNLILVSGE